MALLNLKKGEKGKEEAKKEVPDELPALPEDKKGEGKSDEKKEAEKPAEKKEEAKVEEKKPDQKKAEEKKEEPKAEEKKEGGLAPDELPPISKEKAPAQEAKTPEPVAKTEVEAPQEGADEKLFFSELISRFHNKDAQQDVEKELLATSSSEVISQLDSQWDHQKHEEILAEIDNKIIALMEPLKDLEKEWRAIKLELFDKNKRKKEIEDKIKESSVQLKKLVDEKNKLKNKTKVNRRKTKQ